MKKIFDTQRITSYLKDNSLGDIFLPWLNHMFLTEYEAGEFPSAPFHETPLLQVVLDGTLSIYCVRDDGSLYFLNRGGPGYLLGDLEFFKMSPLSQQAGPSAAADAGGNIYAEANTTLLSLCLPLENCYSSLGQDSRFLLLLGDSLAAKLRAGTDAVAIHASLKDRVLSHMKWRCPEGTLAGIEKHAFRLHCSARQLQRILNDLEKKAMVVKCGKGTYRLVR